MSESLTPQEKVKKKKDFYLIYRKGRRFRGKFFNLVFVANDLVFSRMAAVASRKVGNAVKRNRAKRLMRELFRKNKDLFTKPVDIIFIARREILDASWSELKEEYASGLKFVAHSSSRS
jgi:ribonuclease P protein component